MCFCPTIDKTEVIKLLNSGRTRDQFFGTCARNIWFQAVLMDVEIKYVSYIAPHSVAPFDSSRYLAAKYITFTSGFIKLNLKCSKTLQTRDTVQALTLPKLASSLICSYKVLKSIFKLYNPFGNEPLF